MFSRFGLFFAGILVGCVLMWGGLKYHIVRAEDGLHMVPKMNAQLSGAYVDVRHFTLQDWNEHRELAAALVRAEKGHVLQDAASEGFHEAMTTAIDAITQPRR